MNPFFSHTTFYMVPTIFIYSVLLLKFLSLKKKTSHFLESRERDFDGQKCFQCFENKTFEYNDSILYTQLLSVCNGRINFNSLKSWNSLSEHNFIKSYLGLKEGKRNIYVGLAMNFWYFSLLFWEIISHPQKYIQIKMLKCLVT